MLRVSPNLAVFTRQKQSLNGIDRWGFVDRVCIASLSEPDVKVEVFNQAKNLFVIFRAEVFGHFLECSVQV